MLVGLSRPGDRAARRYALASLLLSSSYLAVCLPREGMAGVERLIVLLLISGTQPGGAIGYHFFLEFPTRLTMRRLWPRLGVILGVGGATLGLTAVLSAYVLSFGPVTAVSWAFLNLQPTEQVVDTCYGTLLTLSVIALVLHKRRAATDSDQKRRVEWVLLGSVVAFVPIVLVNCVGFVALLAGRADWLFSWEHIRLIVVSRVVQVIAPTAFFYAIVKHRLFDIRFVVRQGLRYAFAKNLLRVSLLAPAVLVAYGAFSSPDRSLRQVLLGTRWYPLLIAGSGIALFLRGRVLSWLDRRFFREAYDRAGTIVALVSEVRSADSITDACRLSVRQLDAALHPQAIRVFFRHTAGHGFALEHSLEQPAKPLTIAEGSGLIRFAEASAGAREIPPDASLDPGQVGTDARLVVPMRTGDGDLAGVLVLGEKKSDEPYSQEDRGLLDALGAQLASLYEMLQLRKRVVDEAKARHEVLARLDAKGLDVLRECPSCGACAGASVEFCARDGSTLVLTVPVERTIHGRYRLDRAIGKGGMGVVYEATDLRLDRGVAVKVMSAAGWQGSDPLKRFAREARALARLRHPNVVALFDYGEPAAGGAYLVMELLTGTTLRRQLERVGRLDAGTVASWFSQVFDGVEAAHAAGVIHRDLKPENVFLSSDTSGWLVKILDFGVAKLQAGALAESERLTVSGAVIGTRTYMSPEQLAGLAVDERTDVFSLGLVLLECLTGRRPVDARKTFLALSGSASVEMRRLAAALERCVAGDPAARFPSVAAMKRDLLPLIPSWVDQREPSEPGPSEPTPMM
jgi:hypothetical protein